MSITIFTPQQWTQKDVARSHEHPGRRTQTSGYKSPAAWISDLSELKKIVLLCSFCRTKWNPRKHGYRKYYVPDATGKSDGYTHGGMCDGCKQRTENTGGGTAFIHESTFELSCIDPGAARARARAKWRQASSFVPAH